MAKHILPAESKLVGGWELVSGQMQADATTKRIELAIQDDLELIKRMNWMNLYQDPETGLYWLQEYFQGEMHGGGPPSLRLISPTEAEHLLEPQ